MKNSAQAPYQIEALGDLPVSAVATKQWPCSLDESQPDITGTSIRDTTGSERLGYYFHLE